MKTLAAVLMVAATVAGPAAAQTIPEGSQASKVEPAYRRTPSFRNDPFRHVAIPHWGFVASLGASAANNTLNASDLGALIFLSDEGNNPGGLLLGDAFDMLGLIPQGSGLRGSLQGEGGFYLGGPFGGRVSIGFSARGAGYGSFLLDDQAVSLLRDGNGALQNFSLGSSSGVGLATAEGGAHAVLRFGPFGSPDGLKLSLGFGGRYLRPIFYYNMRSQMAGGGTVRVTGDSIIANVALEQFGTWHTVRTCTGPGNTNCSSELEFDINQTVKGSGKAADFLIRFEWPTSGLAFEALVANIGSINVPGVERSTATFQVATNNVSAVADSIDAARFQIAPTDSSTTINLTLPRIVRFTGSAWANRILQIDLSGTLPVSGTFDSPLGVDIVTTWRFIRTLPLRAGVVLGGSQGIGYTGGIAIEGRNMFFQLAGQSLGGFMRSATGAGMRLELGLFF